MTVEGGINSWTSNGPDGGQIVALAIDPVTPATLYAGTDRSGVFKSTDGGESWSAVNTGLPNPKQVSVLAIDPQTSATLYAGTYGGGVFKSNTSGGRWSAVHTDMTHTKHVSDPAIHY